MTIKARLTVAVVALLVVLMTVLGVVTIRGSVRVDRAPGGGAAFSVSLPVLPAPGAVTT